MQFQVARPRFFFPKGGELMDDRIDSFLEKPWGLQSSYPNLLVFVVKESGSIS